MEIDRVGPLQLAAALQQGPQWDLHPHRNVQRRRLQVKEDDRRHLRVLLLSANSAGAEHLARRWFKRLIDFGYQPPLHGDGWEPGGILAALPPCDDSLGNAGFVVESCERVIQNVGAPAHLERSEEHTSELQSLMRISYAVFCLKKKKTHNIHRK